MSLGKRFVALAGALVVVLALAGCRDAPDAEVEPLATASPSPSPTATPTPEPEPEEPEPDPLAIPEDPAAIDEAYLLDVLGALFSAETDRIRHELTARERDDEWHAWLAALYTPDQHDFQIRLFDQIAPTLDSYRPVDEVEDISVAGITSVITATPECVFVEVPYRRAAILPGEPEWEPAFVSLVPHDGQADPARNATPWWFIRWVTGGPGGAPENPCA